MRAHPITRDRDGGVLQPNLSWSSTLTSPASPFDRTLSRCPLLSHSPPPNLVLITASPVLPSLLDIRLPSTYVTSYMATRNPSLGTH